MTALRIGVLGAAKITPSALLKPARQVGEVTIAAVAARDPARARGFATRHGIATVHNDYQELIDDPSIDAVYNPLPPALHGRWTIAALEAGKHVLCEKPFTANADEARAVEQAARGTGLVVMEAFHYRYHPLARRLVDIVASGELGAIRSMDASFCAALPPSGARIQWQAALGGGATMDLGCYPIHLLRTLAGAEPEVISARAEVLPRAPGIDRLMRAELTFPGAVTGRVSASMWSSRLFSVRARVIGDAGELRVCNYLSPQTGYSLTVRTSAGRRRERLTREPTYLFQLRAFAAAVLRDGPVLTGPQDAVANMRVIDAVYRAAGLEPRQPAYGLPGADQAEQS